MEFSDQEGRGGDGTLGSLPQGGGEERFPRSSGDGQININAHVKAFTFQYHNQGITLYDSRTNLVWWVY